jgi:O-antigen/teichoic acid export membrane protein
VLRVPAAPQPDLTRRLLRHGSRVYVVGLLTFVLIRLDLLLVNAVVGAEAAGQYSVAAFVAEGLVLIPIVVGTNLVPRLAVTAENNLLVLVFRTLLVVWGAICLLSIPGAAVGIPLLFGERYDAAVELYLWLLPGTFAMGMLNSLTIHYFVRGYPPALMAAWGVGLVLNVALNLVLLPGLGVVAAPVLSSLAYAGVLLAHVRLFARDVGGVAALRPRPREVVGLVRGSFTA